MKAPTAPSIPGSGPPSRVNTPSGTPPALTNPAVSALNGAGAGTMAPPSRPGTSLSTASSIDDLMGAPPGPGARKGGTVKKGKKKREVVDVLAK